MQQIHNGSELNNMQQMQAKILNRTIDVVLNSIKLE
jgi:hypothetical protein